MGNTQNTVTEGNKAQADADTFPLYKLVDIVGNGQLVELMKQANINRDYTQIDEAIDRQVKPYLYNEGRGKVVTASEMVYLRKCYRHSKVLTPFDPSKVETDSSKRKNSKNRERKGSAAKTEESSGPRAGGAAPISNGWSMPDSPSRESNMTNSSAYTTCTTIEMESELGNGPATRGGTASSSGGGTRSGTASSADFGNGVDGGGSKGTNSRSQVSPAPPDSRLADEKRLVCWNLYNRGGVGETILHICLLNGTALYADLAKRLLHRFPLLAVDIYISDQYYGENVLHMAIVNEDPAMVKFLLDLSSEHLQSWPVHLVEGAEGMPSPSSAPPQGDNPGRRMGLQRRIYDEICLGGFFSSADQVSSRSDMPNTERMSVPLKTSYEGYLYWGGFPLPFAACLGQEECVRLLIANKADPNLQDNNGNTALHMLVIHNKKEMFDLVHSLGGDIHVKNNQGLTPLTLAAKLARREMYNHILEKERNVYWIYGGVTCAAYPLADIDSIDEKGGINTKSALHLIVHGDEVGHLEMVDGMIINLLKEKWQTFAQWRFRRRFFGFLFYFCVFVMAFIYRPGDDRVMLASKDAYDEAASTANQTVNDTIVIIDKDICYLRRIVEPDDKIRVVFESLTLTGAIIYIILACKEIFHQGRKFFGTLTSAPSKATFLMSCIFVTLMLPARIGCSYVFEDVLAVLAILFTAPYFLFFCRGVKFVGPFVVMIYKMIVGDFLRFFTIYAIFLVGFSQAMFVVFIHYVPLAPKNRVSPFHDPLESLMGMFYMSMGEFGIIYDSFEQSVHVLIGKFIFVAYMVLVTLLLINMLIAMMGNTYTMINETQKEWLRQWAHIVLVVEQSVTTEERSRQQKNYSQPTDKGQRALVVRWHQSDEEKTSLKKSRDETMAKQRELFLKRRKSMQNKSPG